MKYGGSAQEQPRKQISPRPDNGKSPQGECGEDGLLKNLLAGGGGGGAWSPFSNPHPPPPEGCSKGRLSVFHVFHAYPMTQPLALSQSVTVTVPVSLQRGGGGSYRCQPF